LKQLLKANTTEMIAGAHVRAVGGKAAATTLNSPLAESVVYHMMLAFRGEKNTRLP
jgi:hypothetical protein